MGDIVKLLSDSDAGDIFLWLGGLLLLLGFVGKLGAIIEMPQKRRNLAKITGIAMLVFGVVLEQDLLAKITNVEITDNADTSRESEESKQASSDDPALGKLDWIVVLGSHDAPDKAQRQLDRVLSSLPQAATDNKASFQVVDTTQYSGLTDGYWSVVIKARNQAQARRRLSAVRDVVEGAYIKRAGS